jgi:hypothetical protein
MSCGIRRQHPEICGYLVTVMASRAEGLAATRLLTVKARLGCSRSRGFSAKTAGLLLAAATVASPVGS